MNNDSIRRSEVLTNLGDLLTLCSITGRITEWDLETFEKIIKNLSPAPREMTARELLLTEERMLQEDADAYNKYVSLTWGDRKFDKAAAFAEDWAKKHPEERKRKTYAEDFFERNPQAAYRMEAGRTRRIPYECRMLMYGVSCPRGNRTIGSCADCWYEVMEDEE